MVVTRCAVLVVGDIGRSPRMQYHAISLANIAKMEVDLIGLEGNEPRKEILQHPHIHLHLMKNIKLWPVIENHFVLRSIFKLIFQICTLLWILLTIPHPDFLLVQTPPFLPAVIIAHFVCFLRRSKLIIDWHNFGYTILASTRAKGNTNHFSVRLYKWSEHTFGKGAYGNLCVTEAMQQELKQNWNINAVVLYDRPPEFFRTSTTKERHELFMEIASDLTGIINHMQTLKETAYDEVTPFTYRKDGKVYMRDDRPALLVSSTSWTPDEDFDILLDAMIKYDERALQEERETSKPAVQICLMITGKGPQKEFYEQKIQSLHLKYVYIRTLWLSAKNYPILLGSSDLGISLHTSSSGFDLPMKVVDMFGCGLPVCAVGFKCLAELVQHSKNGLIFDTSDMLAQQTLLQGFPKNTKQLDNMRKALTEFQALRWDDNWTQQALPMFDLN